MSDNAFGITIRSMWDGFIDVVAAGPHIGIHLGENNNYSVEAFTPEQVDQIIEALKTAAAEVRARQNQNKA